MKNGSLPVTTYRNSVTFTKWLFAHLPHIKFIRLGSVRSSHLPFKMHHVRLSPCICADVRIATTKKAFICGSRWNNRQLRSMRVPSLFFLEPKICPAIPSACAKSTYSIHLHTYSLRISCKPAPCYTEFRCFSWSCSHHSLRLTKVNRHLISSQQANNQRPAGLKGWCVIRKIYCRKSNRPKKGNGDISGFRSTGG